MKVLHLLTALGPGGAEVWLLNLIEPLRALGVEVGFVLKAPEFGGYESHALRRGCPTYHVRLGWPPWRYADRVRRIAVRDGYQLVHTHEFVHSAAGVIAAQWARLPSVATFHHWIFEAQTRLTRPFPIRQARRVYGELSVKYTVEHATRITTLSRAVMRKVDSSLVGSSRFSLLQLGVDVPDRPTDSGRARLRAEFGWDANVRVVVHVGRLIEQKNHLGLLEIFRRVHREEPSSRLLLCGDGPMREAILARITELPCRAAVVYAGLRHDVARLLSASDVLLFPSRDEGFGLVALEANAAALPVVGARIDGLDEAVIDGETAVLLPVDDLDGLAQATLRFLRDPDMARMYGSRGRERASREFSHDASAHRLAEVYRAVLLESRHERS
jgi:glycosyltransferase involved in cell wall biosynthesis